MKKFLLYTATVLTALAPLTSCDSWLEEESFGRPTTDTMLQNEKNMVLLVGQAYAEVKWLHDHWGYWGINTISADEAMCPIRNPGSHWNDDGYWGTLNTQLWDADGMAFEFLWKYSNAGAVLCNKILKQISVYEDKVDPETYKRYVAELKVLRSYYYYTLFDCFGRIPYVEDFTSDNVPQSEPYQVWEKLVNDLEENAPNLPVVDDSNRSQNYGRATQGLAYALLARLYLNAESYGVTPQNVTGYASSADFYNKCVTACDKIIDAGSYRIEGDFFNNFLVHNEGSVENIFVIVENGNSAFDYRDYAGKMANKLRITMLTLHYQHQQLWGLIEKPWNGFCASPSFIEKYAAGDRRGPCSADVNTGGTRIDFEKDKWGWFVGPVYAPTGDTIARDENGTKVILRKEVQGLTDATWNDGARMLKYQVEKNSTVNKYCENDFVLFRYADVLYMKGEALIRAGRNAEVSNLLSDGQFQQIRARVGMPVYTVADFTLSEILDERGREFAWENIRRRDLIRYGQFAEGTWTFKPARESYRNWFPISNKVLETEPLWTQNEGY